MGFTDPLRRAFGTPRQRPLSSVASYLVYADVRLHTPMTHRNDAGTLPLQNTELSAGKAQCGLSMRLQPKAV